MVDIWHDTRAASVRQRTRKEYPFQLFVLGFDDAQIPRNLREPGCKEVGTIVGRNQALQLLSGLVLGQCNLVKSNDWSVSVS